MNLLERAKPVIWVIARIARLYDAVHEGVHPQGGENDLFSHQIPSTDIAHCQCGLLVIALAVPHKLPVQGESMVL